MMSEAHVIPPEGECSRHCRSLQHGATLASSLSLRGVSGTVLIPYLRWLCANCGQVADMHGRTALHLAASCGQRQVVRWLIKQGDANVNAKDVESGYTPLHRSVFYGQIHIATSLIQLGANINAVDHEDLTAIDHAMKDRLPYVEYNLTNPCEVYIWGTNNNYTLGTGNQHSRSQPEVLEYFRKQSISIKQVAVNKFHSVFVTHDGRVYSCGHGQGGRLGVDSEQAMLYPHQMKLSNQPDACVAVSLGRDHTVLLMDSGTVMTCGLNAHHQLGHSPPPSSLLSPRALTHKSVKSVGAVLGVCAARFHTVIWGSKAVLTCGLHAGQLGYPKGPGSTQIIPKLVPLVGRKDCPITHAAASDGATVIVVKKGDIYVLHEYQCRKIASRQLDVVKVAVVGGHLDSKVDASVLMDQGGERLQVAVLTSTGRVLLWQESTLQLTRCIFNLNRPLMVTDFTLNRCQILLVTRDGEAFEGEIKGRKPKKPLQEMGRAFHEFTDREECEMVKLKRLLHIHRAVSVTSDLKGRNFAIIQTHPKAALLEIPQVDTTDMKQQMLMLLQEANVQDIIHDVVFQVGTRSFAAHQYVIASHSEPLANLIQVQAAQLTPCKGHTPQVKLNHMRPEIFDQILQYIYTNDCELVRPGICPVKISPSGNDAENLTCGDHDVTLSALNTNSEDTNNKKTKGKLVQKRLPVTDPVKLTQEAAKRYGIFPLAKKLDGVRYEDGCILAKGSGSFQPAKVSFDIKKHQDLYDVTVKSEEGRELRAHKCILAARLEYFNSMLSHGWLEASESSCLCMPFPYNVLQVLLDFLYQDECPVVQASDDLDLICNVLVVADQLFATRLKEFCEVALASLITLRNVPQILQFADMYCANQLKQCCMQYVSLNLSALLESRALEILSEAVLEDLSKYYCALNPSLCRRIITPYANAPSVSFVEAVADMYPVNWQDDEDEEFIDIHGRKSTKTSKRKPKLRKISSGDPGKGSERTRNESVSSCISDDAEISKDLHSLSFEDLTERNAGSPQNVTLTLSKLDARSENGKTGNNAPWVKIKNNSKHHKIVQARLRAISAVKESPSLLDETKQVFTKLTAKSSNIAVASPSDQNLRSHQETDSLSQQDVPISATPPDLILDFPELQRSPLPFHDGATHARPAHKNSDIKKPVKISQKQRKKMAAEFNAASTNEHCNQASQSRPAWGHVAELPNSGAGHYSLVEIMKAELRQNRDMSSPIAVVGRKSSAAVSPQQSPPVPNAWLKTQGTSPSSPGQSPEGAAKFCDIVADERKQRENWTRMRAKPLELTQLEDRAIEELLVFYNAAGATDERITVTRVVTGVVATPTWITSHH